MVVVVDSVFDVVVDVVGFFFFGWWWWVGWLLSWRIKINAKDWTCGNVGFHLVKIKNVVCDFGGGVVVICGFLLLWVGWWFLFSFCWWW